MNVNSYLQSLASDLVLTSSEKASITTSIDAIKTNLSKYFGGAVIEKVVFGSYTRETILPRKADANSDVDLMVVFKNPDNHKPQSFLNRLKDFAENYYSRSEIYQSSPTIVLELNHIKFELVPAHRLYGLFYQIPNGPSDWMTTDPNSFNQELINCNVSNGYKIKPTVRLLKHWNIAKNNRGMASFELESSIAQNMKYAYASCSTYIDYVKKALRTIRDTNNYLKVDAAIDHIDKAIEYEDSGMPYTALAEIKKVFPEI